MTDTEMVLLTRIAALEEALGALDSLYTHAFDTSEGGLVFMPESVTKFEAAHAKARAVLAASQKGEG